MNFLAYGVPLLSLINKYNYEKMRHSYLRYEFVNNLHVWSNIN